MKITQYDCHWAFLANAMNRCILASLRSKTSPPKKAGKKKDFCVGGAYVGLFLINIYYSNLY